MKINFMEKTVLVTKSELSKASVYGSKEYHELLAIRKDLYASCFFLVFIFLSSAYWI